MLNGKGSYGNKFIKSNLTCYKNNCRENKECKKSRYSSQFIAHMVVKFFRYFFNKKFILFIQIYF